MMACTGLMQRAARKPLWDAHFDLPDGSRVVLLFSTN